MESKAHIVSVDKGKKNPQGFFDFKPCHFIGRFWDCKYDENQRWQWSNQEPLLPLGTLRSLKLWILSDEIYACFAHFFKVGNTAVAKCIFARRISTLARVSLGS